MEILELNETPVRTARNFKINNIQLENMEIPNEIVEFKNVEIIKQNSNIDQEVSNKPLVYGTGKILEENVSNNANSKIRIATGNNKLTENIEIIYTFDDDNINLINEIEINAEEKSNIIIKYKSNTAKTCFHNGIIKVNLKENATANITIILSIIIFLILIKVDVDITKLEMPAVYVISNIFGILKYGYGFVILASIFTTAISLGNSFLNNISKNKRQYIKIAIIITIISILVSKVGFSNLVNILYPVFGYLGFVQILKILIKKA